MAYSRNEHTHPMVVVFVFSLVILTALTIAVSFNTKPQTLDSSAQIPPAHPTATRTRTPTPRLINCGGVLCEPYNCHCADGDPCTRVVCRRATPTRTRTPTPKTSNCGGQCPLRNCHCLGGDACYGGECVTDSWIRNVCTEQNRSWCLNYQGAAFTCCEQGYVCNPIGNGCVRR